MQLRYSCEFEATQSGGGEYDDKRSEISKPYFIEDQGSVAAAAVNNEFFETSLNTTANLTKRIQGDFYMPISL